MKKLIKFLMMPHSVLFLIHKLRHLQQFVGGRVPPFFVSCLLVHFNYWSYIIKSTQHELHGFVYKHGVALRKIAVKYNAEHRQRVSVYQYFGDDKRTKLNATYYCNLR